uniref:PH domain-containing protein n=1 Tax=Cyanoderma ruficeps TaxID=181631 RepID=A0A8C3QZY3_9PASS
MPQFPQLVFLTELRRVSALGGDVTDGGRGPCFWGGPADGVSPLSPQRVTRSPLLRRHGVPECILLVTQRITKYPVLIERILKNSKGTGGGRPGAFGRDELLRRKLVHSGGMLWKTAAGRFKDVLVLLMTDVLVFLQEKDQKYTFPMLDKPAVISLQNLIVRDIANQEKGMFLISAAPPEMYEVHAASRDDRNHWMKVIQQAPPGMDLGMSGIAGRGRGYRVGGGGSLDLEWERGWVGGDGDGAGGSWR